MQRGEAPSAAAQRTHMRETATALAPVISAHDVVITHGNGPQVGFLALQTAACGPAMPLDVLGAESEGMIGYVIEQELIAAAPQKPIVTVLTQTVVDATDPSFSRPSKPIGPVYDQAEGQRLAEAHGWALAAESSGVRRIVPSPHPIAVLERDVIALLLDNGVTVVCAGGGGVPVIRQADGSLHGVEAVVDKDRTSALLADLLDIDQLLILTDVKGVYDGWGGPKARVLRDVPAAQLAEMHFPEGSMGPKVEAACHFVSRPGRTAVIGRLQDAALMLEGRAGTRVTFG